MLGVLLTFPKNRKTHFTPLILIALQNITSSMQKISHHDIQNKQIKKISCNHGIPFAQISRKKRQNVNTEDYPPTLKICDPSPIELFARIIFSVTLFQKSKIYGLVN